MTDNTQPIEREVDYRVCCWLSALADAARHGWSRDYWLTRAIEGLRWGWEWN